MAVPKKKMSKMRSKMRRSTWKVKGPNVQLDPKTGTYVLPHRINPSTGTYRGKEVIKTSEA